MSSELDRIKAKKLQEIQASYNEQARQQQEAEQQIQALEEIIKTRLTKKALERYGNVKAAHPEKAMHLLAVLAQAIQTQNIGVINDEQLKNLLMRLTPNKRDFKITRK